MKYNFKENPLYPIKIDDYIKLFDYVLTKDGLIYFHKIKRKYILGKNLSIDEYNKLRIIQIYYATSNRNTNEVSFWQQMCREMTDRGISEGKMYSSKKDLINRNLILKNPFYRPGLYRLHIKYSKQFDE